jgi:SOS-response transcriptional repressor LexA
VSVRLLSPAPCMGGHFTFTLKTDALTHANIPKGSRLLACPSADAVDGDLVIARTPQGKVVRFYRKCGFVICLSARNPDFLPLILPPGSVEILGIVCTLLA